MKKFLFLLIILLLPFHAAFATNKQGTFPLAELEELIRNIAIAAAVLMIVWGGFEWMTSAGDPAKISSAKERIYSAILGLIIIALASTIAAILGAK